MFDKLLAMLRPGAGAYLHMTSATRASWQANRSGLGNC